MVWTKVFWLNWRINTSVLGSSTLGGLSFWFLPLFSLNQEEMYILGKSIMKRVEYSIYFTISSCCCWIGFLASNPNDRITKFQNTSSFLRHALITLSCLTQTGLLVLHRFTRKLVLAAESMFRRLATTFKDSRNKEWWGYQQVQIAIIPWWQILLLEVLNYSTDEVPDHIWISFGVLQGLNDQKIICTSSGLMIFLSSGVALREGVTKLESFTTDQTRSVFQGIFHETLSSEDRKSLKFCLLDIWAHRDNFLVSISTKVLRAR